VSDTYDLPADLSLQLAARLQWVRIILRDRGGDAALNGKHSFLRIDPSAGVTYHPSRALTLFASYSESNRAPSASELSCADPNVPCRLPNAFLSDPPLRQVVTRAAEFGARGQLGESTARPVLRWSVAAFGARSDDDIIFVAGSLVGTGFFQNAGTTQRAGVEFGLSAEKGPIRIYASYSLLRATFESELKLPGGANPGLGAGDDQDARIAGTAGAPHVQNVEKGTRIPGLPAHSFKAGITLLPLPGLSIGLSTIAQSSIPYRGDEANLIEDVSGFAIVSAEASYQLLSHLQLFVKAQNLLNTKYETFGVLAEPSHVIPGLSNPRFLGPGAPFGLWAGMVVD
jgi:outer membrane receptor protein involved in Fe transport